MPGRDRTLPVSGRAVAAREVIVPVSNSNEAAEPSETVDEKVLRLRSKGQPYARISRDLGLDRGVDAQRAFVRALERLPAPDAERVRGEEMSRLDRLADRVRGDGAQNDMDRARRLKTIDRMRTQIGAGPAH